MFSKLAEKVENLSKTIDKLTQKSKEDELKLAIKARDDQIIALKTKIETFEKPTEEETELKEKGDPKTIQDPIEEPLEDNPIKVSGRGEVYYDD